VTSVRTTHAATTPWPAPARTANLTLEMPIDADHATAAVVDTIAVTATDTGSPAEPPAFDSASQASPTRREQPPAPLDAEANAAAATQARSATGWGAMALVVVPLAGALAVLAAVVVVNAMNDWWALVPAMLIALVATACVLATVVHMLADTD
jgi:hypothetical protein